MNGVHDLGGMHGFGPVVAEPNEPVFHADWERRTFALALATMGAGRVNVDEFRHAIEHMAPADYLASSYYEHWLHAVESLLTEKGILRAGEIDSAISGGRLKSAGARASVAASSDADAGLWSNPDAGSARPSSAVALRHDPKFKAHFKPGDRVIARNLNPSGHTRAPRYTRGHRGVIHRDWGAFVFPDTHAHGGGAKPQHCYAVEFTARELWGPDRRAGERVYVDLWEAYLDLDVAQARNEKPAARRVTSARPRKAAVVKTTKKIKRAKPAAGRRSASPASARPAGKTRKRR
ncbi:MAG: nitrile hydratase subunit beta [Candidatus Binataceae bacterium]